MSAVGTWWKGFAIPALLLLLAEFAMLGRSDSSMTLAAPSEVVVALVRILLDGSLLVATRDTLLAAAGGLLIGGLAGLALGVLFGMVPVADRLMEVPVEALRPIPSIAILPVALLVFGFGYRMEIAIVAFACLWPVLILTRSTLAGIEPRLKEVARVLRLSVPARIFKIILPAALPGIFLAFRIAASLALVVAVTVELAANPLGLGRGMLVAQQSLQPEVMLAYLFWIGLLGWAVNAALTILERQLPGHRSLTRRRTQ